MLLRWSYLIIQHKAMFVHDLILNGRVENDGSIFSEHVSFEPSLKKSDNKFFS